MVSSFSQRSSTTYAEIAAEYPTPQSDFEELDLRIQQWALALPPLSIVPANRQDIVRGLLTVKTMCCCSMILIHSSLNPEAPLNDRVASAAQEAVALVQEVDLLALRVVDTVVGVRICGLTRCAERTDCPCI